AQGVLLLLAGGSDLGLFEVNEAADIVTQAAHPEANIIFGAVIDDSLGDEVKVTVIAAGFDKFGGHVEQPAAVAQPAEPVPAVETVPLEEPEDEPDEVFTPEPVQATPQLVHDETEDDEDDLDVPSFLR
ncbi:MAG: hypothetical protein R6V28_01335, partial [Nitriliruptoraceae bacterium]